MCNAIVLQDAQRKALDIINSVGLGDSVLKMIEKRQRGDIYLVLGGMVSAPLKDRE